MIASWALHSSDGLIATVTIFCLFRSQFILHVTPASKHTHIDIRSLYFPPTTIPIDLYLRLTHSISGSFSPWSEHDFNNVISVKSICNDLSPSKHLLVKLKNQSQYRSRKLTDYEMNLWNFSTEIQTRRIEVFVFISAKSIGHFLVLQHSWPSQIESLLSMQAFRSDDSIKRFNSAIFLFVSLFASKLW